jgi:SOUL heme-binding protein
MATTKSKPRGKKAKDKSDASVTGKRVATAAAVVAGVAAVGAGIFFAKEKLSEKPDHATVVDDGEFEIRDYPPLLVAETVVTGATDRKTATGRGFEVLADYIFAKSRDGKKIAMTAPVLAERAAEDSAQWTVRFVMPASYTRETLPPATAGVTIVDVPARRVAAVRFAGTADDAALEAKEAELRAWLDARGETTTWKAEYAFYDAPLIPGILRRNEVLIELG